MCILLVEDEAMIRTIVAEELTAAGFEVCEADTGDHAATLIGSRSDDFSLLITDLHMPGDLDGIGVARCLRDRRPDISVVYITGRPDALDGRARMGRQEVLLAKPFVPSRLLAVVRRLLGTGLVESDR